MRWRNGRGRLAEMERVVILGTLAETGGNRREAARGVGW